MDRRQGTPDRGTQDHGTPNRGTPNRRTPVHGTPGHGMPNREAHIDADFFIQPGELSLRALQGPPACTLSFAHFAGTPRRFGIGFPLGRMIGAGIGNATHRPFMHVVMLWHSYSSFLGMVLLLSPRTSGEA